MTAPSPGSVASRPSEAPAAAAASAAADPSGQPLAPRVRPRADHPLLGLWRLPYPGTRCQEIYRFRTDGTAQISSAEEEAEARYTWSDTPSERGFYAWADRIVRDNGGRDCGGRVTVEGTEQLRYVLMLPSGKVFVACANEDAELTACVGPFIRIEPADGDV